MKNWMIDFFIPEGHLYIYWKLHWEYLIELRACITQWCVLRAEPRRNRSNHNFRKPPLGNFFLKKSIKKNFADFFFGAVPLARFNAGLYEYIIVFAQILGLLLE